MVDNPISNQISNSGVSPTQPTPPYGPDHPRLGSGEEAQEPKPFTLGPEGGQSSTEASSEKPSPMEVAGDAARQQPQMAPEELGGHIVKLNDQLSSIQTKLQDTNTTQKFTTDHFEAMQRLAQKMNPDMQAIAKNSNGQFVTPEKSPGEPVLGYITKWLNGSQGTLSSALDYLQNTKKPDITSYLKLQYAVQRATQKGELFASIVGSSVSGIKTIMSTQLG